MSPAPLPAPAMPAAVPAAPGAMNQLPPNPNLPSPDNFRAQ
jgi:hypothetical protein